MNKSVDIDIITPVYNEGASSVTRFYTAIANELGKIEKEFAQYSITPKVHIIFVDDGSKDNTWQCIEEFNANSNLSVTGIQLSRNFGKEAALTCAISQSNADYSVIIDSDLQHPPKCIAPMFGKMLKHNVDVVDGVKKCRGNETFFNRVSATLFYALLSRLTGMEMKGASDFKIINRKARDAWSQMPEKAIFFRGMISWVGFTRYTFLFEVDDRSDGERKWSTAGLINLALHAITAYSTIPLKIMSGCGLIFVLFAILISISTFIQYLQGTAVTGFTTVILLLNISFGLIMIGLGIIGEYLARIYGEVKGRPRYLINKIIQREAE